MLRRTYSNSVLGMLSSCVGPPLARDSPYGRRDDTGTCKSPDSANDHHKSDTESQLESEHICIRTCHVILAEVM